MVLHVVTQLERLAAEFALERSVAGMGRQMCYQASNVREGFAAELAEDDTGGWIGVGRELEVHRLDRTRSGVVGLARQMHTRLEAQLRLQLQMGRLLAVLERLEAVREDVPRQLALVEERGTAVHARKHPLIHTHQLRIWWESVVRGYFTACTPFLGRSFPVHFLFQRKWNLLNRG